MELNPKDADAYNNLGAALQECGRVKDAEEVLRTCLSINPNHTDAHWNLGLALLALGNWREGWIEYEWRRHLREDLGQKRGFPQPAWNGSPVEGRTVLVMCEQGLGDTIQFIRYVPLLAQRGAKVIVECQSKLRPLLAGLKAAAGGGCATIIARGESLPQFDMHARLMTLPMIFGSTPDDLPNETPYLSVEAKRVERWREELGEQSRKRAGTETRIEEQGQQGQRDRAMGQENEDAAAFSRPRVAASPSPRVASTLRVGLVWQGSTAHKGDRFRSIPLESFKPLAQIPGVQLVSLQKGYGSEQVETLRDRMDLLEWSDPSDTTAEALLDTAAVMQCLDLVIAVDTSLAHLAGALGVAVWVAMPLANDWRWLSGREDSPWYPSMRLFRQHRLGRWEDVIERMAVALRERVGERLEPIPSPAERLSPVAV